MSKANSIHRYSLRMPASLYEALERIARQRGAKLNKSVSVRDVIISCMLSDGDLVKEWKRMEREGRKS